MEEEEEAERIIGARKKAAVSVCAAQQYRTDRHAQPGQEGRGASEEAVVTEMVSRKRMRLVVDTQGGRYQGGIEE